MYMVCSRHLPDKQRALRNGNDNLDELPRLLCLCWEEVVVAFPIRSGLVWESAFLLYELKHAQHAWEPPPHFGCQFTFLQACERAPGTTG